MHFQIGEGVSKNGKGYDAGHRRRGKNFGGGLMWMGDFSCGEGSPQQRNPFPAGNGNGDFQTLARQKLFGCEDFRKRRLLFFRICCCSRIENCPLGKIEIAETNIGQ
jgi:hypothetical protein